MEEFKKVAIIRSLEKDSRTSQVVASANLVRSYELLFEGKKVKTFLVSNNFHDPKDSYNELKKFHPDLIVIIDKKINLAQFFTMLKLFQMDEKSFKTIIHVYGDFISRMGEWKKLYEVYPGLELSVSVASSAQKKIVEQMLKPGPKMMTIPYPVEKVEAIEEENTNFFSEDSIVLLYAGRLSFQKNIIGLLRIMKNINEIDDRFKLLVCGNFDDREEGFEGEIYADGAINVFVSKVMKEIDPHGKFIKFIPKRDRNELFSLYKKVDAFISLSLMHTEDYGIGAAEALSSGLPVFLTRWGGYGDFYKYSSAVHYVDVVKNNGKLEIDENELENKLLHFDFKKFDKEKSKEEFFNSINIKNISEKLKESIGFGAYDGISPMALKSIFDQPLKYIFSNNRNHSLYFGAYLNDISG